MAYRFYVSDELFYLNNTVARVYRGPQFTKRYCEIVLGDVEPEETRTPEEIIEGLKKKMREIE